MSTASEPRPVPYEFQPGVDYTLLKLNGRLNSNTVKNFDRDLSSYLDTHPGNVVIDCECLEEISYHWIRSLMILVRRLDTEKNKLVIFGIRDYILQFLCDQGVSQALPVRDSLSTAILTFKSLQKVQLDVQFVNPFLTATMNVLKIQAFTNVKAGAIRCKARDDKFLGDISGVIGMSSDGFSGSVAISFPSQTFLKIISRMLGEEFNAVNNDIIDGAAEITSMIFGQAKLELNQKGYGIKTTLPSVTSVAKDSAQSDIAGPRIVVPFETDVGSFFVEICLVA